MLAFALFACACHFFWTHRDVPKNPPCLTSAGGRSRLSDGYRTPAARVPRLRGAATNSTVSAETPLSFAHLLSPSATNYQGSICALQALPPVLSAEQVEALRDVLAVPYDPRMPGTLIEFNGVKNAAAEFLLQQPDFPSDLLLDFAFMFDDPAHDPVWRDYCLQMLVTGWLGLSDRGGPDASAARDLAVTVLAGAAETRDHTWPGTALLGLHTILSADPDAFSREAFGKMIVAVASDASASEPARITALRLAGSCRVSDARTAALELAKTGATGFLRAAAVATLGELGNPADQALLMSFDATDDPFVFAAARLAREKQDRFKGAGSEGLGSISGRGEK